MSRDLQDQIESLRKSLRRWKLGAGLVGAPLVLLLLAGLGSAVAAKRAATREAEMARYHAEQARRQIEQAREDADEAVRRPKPP
jgi:hypothetical protein